LEYRIIDICLSTTAINKAQYFSSPFLREEKEIRTARSISDECSLYTPRHILGVTSQGQMVTEMETNRSTGRKKGCMLSEY
jgi:hypothetical protein